MKTRSFDVAKNFHLFTFLGLLILAQACASLPNYQVSPTLKNQPPKKVGVIVSRMGSLYPGDISHITLKTNYKRRRPRKPNYWGLDEEKMNVFIETNERLQKSVPTYPLFKVRSRIKEVAQYYQNISAPIKDMLENTLTQKGYQVVDLTPVMQSWSPPYSEQSMKEIITNLKTIVDAVVVFHYMGVRDHSYSYHMGSVDQIGNRRITKTYHFSGSTAGFAKLHYSMTMFDTVSQKTLAMIHVKDGIEVTDQQARKSDHGILLSLLKQIKETGPAYDPTIKGFMEVLP